VDGRNAGVPGYEQGYFLKPNHPQRHPGSGVIATTELFGPVLGMMPSTR
jgi:malonate-semialdehyde dehydrogenase (acetylating) / methylmalonate-semialdehyde dehydrogenase